MDLEQATTPRRQLRHRNVGRLTQQGQGTLHQSTLYMKEHRKAAIRGKTYWIAEWGISTIDRDIKSKGAPVNECTRPDFERYPKAMSLYNSDVAPAVNSPLFPSLNKIEEILIVMEQLRNRGPCQVPLLRFIDGNGRSQCDYPWTLQVYHG